MKYYIAALLNADDTRHPVDRGGGVSENAALRVAVRLANAEKHDACVVELGNDGQERIVQRVRFRNDVALGEVADSQSDRFMVSPWPLSETAIQFITMWFERGRSVTLSSARMTAEPSVNIVASKS